MTETKEIEEAEPSQELGTDPPPSPDADSQGADIPSVLPPGGLSKEHAERQAYILSKASTNSPVRQTRFLLDAMAQEWEKAVKGMNQAGGDGEASVIEMAGSMTRGMKVWKVDLGWVSVTRILRRSGDWALHCRITDDWQLDHNDRKRDVWLNMFGEESPVVVLA